LESTAIATDRTISIVGAGNLGRVLALSLHAEGFRISEIITRDNAGSLQKASALAKRVGARASSVKSARLDADVIWLCVPDDAIASVARELSNLPVAWKGKTVLHASGALPSSELLPLKKKGAAVASLHPMNTFVAGSKPTLAGTPFAVEGDVRAVKVAREIASKISRGGEVFTIKAEAKVLYHAAGAFASPLLISMLNVAERVAKKAGIKKPNALMIKILLQTIENFLQNGSQAAFSGPIRRGDVATVRKHLEALKDVPDAREVYTALAENAIQNLPVKNEMGLRKVLKTERGE
jgi:predicted short-subunit dehydrogenase-like oxidoreductase (DUF2520 family)